MLWGYFKKMVIADNVARIAGHMHIITDRLVLSSAQEYTRWLIGEISMLENR